MALPSRARRYTIDTVATTSAGSSSPELTPSATSNAASGCCSRKILEAVPELDAANTIPANPGNETIISKEKAEVEQNSSVENIQSLMEEEDVGRSSSPQISPIPPVDNLKYLSVSPPRSCASLTVRATPRAANEISTRFVIHEINELSQNRGSNFICT